ncbi:MAG: ATP-binding protein, partial [Chloroflexi bacterium]
MGTSFVGRQTELALLESICSNAIAEETPSAVLISGPPGSGKSRLLTEFASRQRSLRPLRMAGYEAGNRVPLAAAADLMRELSKVSGAGAMLSELLFEPTPAKHSSLEPLRIFEAARRSLLGFADPLLLVVDDVQWIDELSVALCAYLVRTVVTEQTEFIVIAAGRPSHETIVFW